MIRVGIGTDKHRLVEGRPLILGGVKIDAPKGAMGHSDADALAHAVTDAILGAAAKGDIGTLFPDTDPEWKDADSIELLKASVRIVRDAGYVPVNIDAVVHLQEPKLGPYKAQMAVQLADALGITPDMVSVKAKSGEGTGEVGTGMVIETIAVALIESAS